VIDEKTVEGEDGLARVSTSEKSDQEEEEEKRPAEHTVTGGETLVSIAAMYDVTPSQLAQHNKLGTLFDPSRLVLV
jgi:LysM repeat protein